MNIPFVSFEHRNNAVRSEALKIFEEFFDSKWYVLGNFTKQFEKLYAEFNQTQHCVGVSTGLDALHLALRALDIKEGDEVIVPSNTYIATVLAISYTGATPIFVEPRRESLNLNPELIEAKITEKTKCIMPVHLYGQACEMDAIMDIADKYKLYVVEDNAQAHGARFNGKLTGSFGDINATSFYPTKNLGALGEAGAITTNKELFAQKVKTLRNYGSQKRYHNEVIGYNNRIDEFEAAYLTIALKHLEQWDKNRSSLAQMYKDALSEIEEITLPTIMEGATTVNHLFVLRLKNRDKIREFLKEKGIGTQIHYPIPPHLQKAYSKLGYKKGDFPIAEEIANSIISLPLWYGMEENQVRYITDQLKKAIIAL